eukprot:TRINITY_DN567_c0_g1_i1.p1 TRINITY_DN567_c0_g1~~TRINITY_DN567_c0_g1_i1.p1  ORF type:complete len:249 (-),score=39.56 TRINITY_DN567_c0_g1_i1:586-1272(-)
MSDETPEDVICRTECETQGSDARSLLPRKLLILGSSVCRGCGADSSEQGWVSMLAQKWIGIEFVNKGASGSNIVAWNQKLARGFPSDFLDEFGVVIFSIAMGNEGLPQMVSPEEIETLTARYLGEMRKFTQTLRSRMRVGSRLVLGSPYPNGGFHQKHLEAILRIRDEFRTWDEVDYVIDFLQPVVHDGCGRWHKGASADHGHPNNTGHAQMLECIDPAAVLGPLLDT